MLRQPLFDPAGLWMAEGLTDRDLAEQGIPIDHTEFATSIASDASSLFTRPVHK
jgi:hypothetical protein